MEKRGVTTDKIIIAIDTEATGRKIAELISKSGLKKKRIAEALCIRPQTIYKWINGTSLPMAEYLIALSVMFNVSMEDMIVWKKVE